MALMHTRPFYVGIKILVEVELGKSSLTPPYKWPLGVLILVHLGQALKCNNHLEKRLKGKIKLAPVGLGHLSSHDLF
jgi:hypothetical protein